MDAQLYLLAACLGFGLSAALLVICVGRSVRRAAARPLHQAVTSQRRQFLRQRARDESELFAFALPFIDALAPLFRRARFAGLRQYMAEPASKAGYPGGLDEAELLALATLAGVLLTGLLTFSMTVLLGLVGLVIGPVGLAMGVLGVAASLRTQGETREKRIEVALPYALDLVVLILRAGASVGIALERVVQDYADHPLGDEFGQVLADIQLGTPRHEAFGNLAQRVPLEEVQSLVDNVVQAEELGWPLAQTIERLADRMNRQRIAKAEEFAGTASVIIMLPSTLVLIAVLILLFGPVIVKYLRGDLSF